MRGLVVPLVGRFVGRVVRNASVNFDEKEEKELKKSHRKMYIDVVAKVNS